MYLYYVAYWDINTKLYKLDTTHNNNAIWEM